MSKIHSRSVLRVMAASVLFLMTQGCGLGRGIVEKVSLNSKQEGKEVWVEMVADLRQGGFQLPAATLPLKDPKNPSRVLGEIVTNQYSVTTRVNATEIVKVPIGDGSKLPNGALLPIKLDGNAVPVAIPVFKSKSQVYFAANGSQIMLGVAISILKEEKLNLPLNLFFPFSVSPKLQGTAGFFLGDPQGIGIFALSDQAAVDSPSSDVTIASAKVEKSLSAARVVELTRSVASPRIRVMSEPITARKLNQLGRTSQYYEGVLSLD
jgi:hypothetical protein